MHSSADAGRCCGLVRIRRGASACACAGHHTCRAFNHLLSNGIGHFYPASKPHSVPCDVLRTVWFSGALGSSRLSPATLAPNETSTCTGHTPARSNELTCMEGHTCTRPPPFLFRSSGCCFSRLHICTSAQPRPSARLPLLVLSSPSSPGQLRQVHNSNWSSSCCGAIREINF